MIFWRKTKNQAIQGGEILQYGPSALSVLVLLPYVPPVLTQDELPIMIAVVVTVGLFSFIVIIKRITRIRATCKSRHKVNLISRDLLK